MASARLTRAHAWAMLGLTLGAVGCGEDANSGSGTGSSGNTTAGNGGAGSGGSGSGASGGSSTGTNATVSSSAVGSTGTGSGGAAPTCDRPPPAGSIWEQTAETYASIDPVQMCIYRDDVLLVVNVAAL